MSVAVIYISCIFVLAVYCFGIYTGCKLSNRGDEEITVGPRRRKAHVPRYHSGNLLDPITPDEQRLEKKLEVTGRKGKNGGAVDG
jgi:hypothetical protein